MDNPAYSRHEESNATIRASAAQLFARLDDQTRLSAHMSKRSWRIGWGKMDSILDAQRAFGGLQRANVLGPGPEGTITLGVSRK